MDAVIGNALTETWLPVIGGVSIVVTLIFAALRRPNEEASRLYGDAMKMVAELKGQVAEETARREALELRLVEAKAERYDLEQLVFRLRTRIEELERKFGGRREDDEPE